MKKPPEWDESNPEKVPDPDAVKPKDWDDEEDGEWEAPLVRNPACDTVQGCGPWVTPMIKNPEYKGKWNPPFIPNPAFIGAWKPKQIPNPDQSYDAHPVKNLSPIVGIAIEVWTTSGGITFDNILLSTDIKHAWKVAEETFLVKSTLEKQREENEKKEKLHQVSAVVKQY